MVVQIVIDKNLLRATDQVAKRTKRNRSAVVREALREHLRKLQIQEMEERERQSYISKPQDLAEVLFWEGEASWPDE